MANYGDAQGGDIEEPFPSDTAAVVANSDHPHEIPDSIKDDDDHDHTGEAGIQAKSISLPNKVFTKISHFFGHILMYFLLFLLRLSHVPYCVAYIFITGDTTCIPGTRESAGTKEKRKRFVKVKINGPCLTMAIRLGCLVLAWLVLNLTIPNLKGLTLFGSLLWRWPLLAAIIIIGYPIIILIYVIFGSFIIYEALPKRFSGSNIEYYLEGLSGSIMLIIYFASILATWLLCIHTNNPQLHRYGMLTLVSFLVGTVLNVVKCILLMLWKTKLIYNRYDRKILSAGCLFYFHICIMVPGQFDSPEQLVPWWDWHNSKARPLIGSARVSQGRRTTLGVTDGNGRANRWGNHPVEDYMRSISAKVNHIDDIATYLINNFESTLTEDNDIPDVAYNLVKGLTLGQRQHINTATNFCELLRIDEYNSKLLIELLRTGTGKETPIYGDFEKWMVDGFNLFNLVGFKLKGAIERLNNLNRVLTGSIVVLVILVWLFITGLATTSVIVALASLFLGMSFVFADACKAFFLGLTFTFVIHPYDVGDRCVIDDLELIVKKVNILSTVFENKEKNTVIFQNLELSTKNIVILENEPGWYLKSGDIEEDCIELHLDSSTTASQIGELQKQIERCLQDAVSFGRCIGSYDVTVEEDGKDMKMSIQFNHYLPGDASNKKRRRSYLFLKIRQLMDDITLANQGSPIQEEVMF